MSAPNVKAVDPIAAFCHLLENDVELLERVEARLGQPDAPASSEASSGQPDAGAEENDHEIPPFPRAAWRGLFRDYRVAMDQTTEAADAFHFAALWARVAVELGRRVQFSYGMPLYPNVFLVLYGPTGDKKTTAMRRVTDVGSPFRTIRGGGSGEGLADCFADAEPDNGLLIYLEEFSQVLRVGKWTGATLLPFLTQCFDCPDRYEMKFRKSPISLERPTPSLLAGTTAEWFWQDFPARDFQGGWGNRIFFLTDVRKPAIALPKTSDLSTISQAVNELAAIKPIEARLSSSARALWHEFYTLWDEAEPQRGPLFTAAVKRIPGYILKLSMVYACCEGTLPEITLDQLSAAIQVGRYGEKCARNLLALQYGGTNRRKELERRIMGIVCRRADTVLTKHIIYKALWRHYGSAEEFNRAFDSLVRAGELFIKPGARGSIVVSAESLR
jgi:hypothetical protein